MTPERWAQIEELFHRAAECDPEQRGSLLDDACRNDPGLRREVDVLLSSDRRARSHVKSAVSDGLNAFTFSLAGEVVSHYRILEGLGGGGMGLVYRAEDLNLGRRVAIKFLPEESTKDPAALGRFQREARSASALEHPNICPIYEFGQHEGQPFLVMQLLEGQTLRDLISAAAYRKPPLPLDKLLDIAVQIADALQAAHKKGIIHRDIKPANIFVTTEGQTKILDFGLAKLARAEQVEADESELDHRDGGSGGTTRETARSVTDRLSLSRTGIAIGTAAYMSPEQARGEELDARSDLFSFGLVLYEMATGQRAFVGDTGPMLHAAILNECPAPVRQLNPKLPVRFERIINKALEENRERRYQIVAQLHAELEILQREIEPRTLPVRSTLGFAVVIVFLMGAAIFWFARRQAPFSQALLDLKLSQLTANSSENPVKGGVISPDGKFLAYTDGKGMHIKAIGGDEAQSVLQPDGLKISDVSWEILAGGWLPDSTRFLANAHPAGESDGEWSSQTSSIWLISATGGAPRKLRDHAVAWSVSPNGSLISFGANNGKLGEREIWLMDQTGERARQLYTFSQNNKVCCFSFLPYGQRVSYILSDDSGDTLVARDLKGGPATTLLLPSEIKKLSDFTFLPDGRLIYSELCAFIQALPDRPCNYWVMRIDTWSGNVIEKPKRLTNWVGFWMNGASATADGKRVAFLRSSSVGVSSMTDLQAGGTSLINSRRFTSDEGGSDAIQDWTADSKAVIVAADRGDHYSLRLQQLNSDTQTTILPSAPGLVEEAWVSPDGKWVIAQVRQLPEGVKLMRVPIAGGSPELIFPLRKGTSFSCAKPPANLCAQAEPSDDRKQMIITSFDPVKGRGHELARFDLSPDLDLTGALLQCVVSPDGTRVAAAPGPEGPIQIRSLRSGRQQMLRTKDLGKLLPFEWASDGKGLVVPVIANGAGEIVYLDLQGKIKVLWKCEGDNCYAVASPDGRHLAVYERKLSANMWMMENF